MNMSTTNEHTDQQPMGATRLPRGGYIVKTEAGIIQFGSPPETIKDTMVMDGNVPLIFVLPDDMFNVEKGIAVAELEFPIYYNHFLKQKKTTIIGTDEQWEQLKVVLQESVFGPENIDLRSEFPKAEDSPGWPDLKAEMDYFRGDRKLDDLVKFERLENNSLKIKNVEIKKVPNKGFSVEENGKIIAFIPRTIDYKVKYDVGATLPEPFTAPKYGITCLGPSHGFDPNDNTSGFLLWINSRGIMIDPPVNSTEWLRESNVNPKLISHVILTHCHADHDAGTFQKILEEFSITIHTTETIMDSFLRKYTALTRLPARELYELFDFNPVMIDSPVFIEGAEFIFHYTVHSIPTIGFRMRFRNRGFTYTSDHLNHPPTFKKMREKGVFTESRYRFLMDFQWNADVIYHETGIPPLHTPVSYLASLPEEIQKKITVYHIARKDFPINSKLNLAKFGIENTLYPEVSEPRFKDAIKVLDVINNVDIFQDFPIAKAREFLSIIQEQKYKKGEKILQKGEAGDQFYIVLSGVVRIEGITTTIKKTFGKYEYFGEASLISGERRSANVFAETEVELLVIEKNAFLFFIKNTDLANSLMQLAETRDSNSWDTLSKSDLFKGMTSHQKTQLEKIMYPVDVSKNEVLMQAGEIPKACFILDTAIADVLVSGRSIGTLRSGDFAGDIFGVQKAQPLGFSIKIKESGSCYKISAKALSMFVRKNPGVYMRLLKGRELLQT